MTDPCLESLPEELQTHILQILGHPRDLLSIEKTCKTFKAVLQDDDGLWAWHRKPKTPYRGDDPRISTHRHHSCISLALREDRRQQKCSDWIFCLVLDESSPDDGDDSDAVPAWSHAWQALVIAVLTEFLPGELLEGRDVSHRYVLHVATYLALLTLVEEHVIELFQRALKVLMAESEIAPDKYPILSRRHLKLAFSLCSSDHLNDGMIVNHDIISLLQWDENVWTRAAGLLDARKRDRIIRLLAYRAGVVVVDNDVYDWTWLCVVRQVLCRLLPACKRLVLEVDLDTEPGPQKKRKLLRRNDGYYLPPFSEYIAEYRTWRHFPVPGQLGNPTGAAPKKVYGLFPGCGFDEHGKPEEPYYELESSHGDDDGDSDDDGGSVVSFSSTHVRTGHSDDEASTSSVGTDDAVVVGSLE